MAKKKKMTKAERKEARLRKGKQWLLTYTGSPKKMNKHYRERFHVDAVTAAKDLQELADPIPHCRVTTMLNYWLQLPPTSLLHCAKTSPSWKPRC